MLLTIWTICGTVAVIMFYPTYRLCMQSLFIYMNNSICNTHHYCIRNIALYRWINIRYCIWGFHCLLPIYRDSLLQSVSVFVRGCAVMYMHNTCMWINVCHSCIHGRYTTMYVHSTYTWVYVWHSCIYVHGRYTTTNCLQNFFFYYF